MNFLDKAVSFKIVKTQILMFHTFLYIFFIADIKNIQHNQHKNLHSPGKNKLTYVGGKVKVKN